MSSHLPASMAALAACCREEIARLALLLDELGQAGRLRAVDGEIILLTVAGTAAIGLVAPTGVWLSAPIYQETGAAFAFIELAPVGREISKLEERLSQALLQATARAITERWFRLHFPQCWIVAGRTARGVSLCVTLAVDVAQTIVGADHATRHWLQSRGTPWSPDLTLSTLLRAGELSLIGRRNVDFTVSLPGSADGMHWIVLITPPWLAVGQARSSEALMLHSRPRLDTLARSTVTALAPARVPGLPPRMLLRIQQHIDAHLDSALNVEALAVGVGISASHFARGFRSSVGLTPHNYVMRRRLIRAQELLADTDLALADIALRTGFSDQSHFSRRFHQLAGLPPRAFRAQHR